jgi:hypothetical protein
VVEIEDIVEEVVERLSQAPRRWIGVVGGWRGVMGFEVRGPVNSRWGLLGAVGTALFSGTENAEPMSDSVSERTCMRIVGAKCGTCWDGEGGGPVFAQGDCER